MQSSNNDEPVKAPRQVLVAVNGLNTIVLDKIMIEVEVYYDLTLPETWDDVCRLWTVYDDGTYDKKSISLVAGIARGDVRIEGQKISVRFRDVTPRRYYSCVIDQRDGNTVSIFQHLLITKEMAIDV